MDTSPRLTSKSNPLSGPLREFADKQVVQVGSGSARERVQQLVGKATDNADTETKLLQAVELGGRIELNDEFWQKKDSRIAELIRERTNSPG